MAARKFMSSRRERSKDVSCGGSTTLDTTVEIFSQDSVIVKQHASPKCTKA